MTPLERLWIWPLGLLLLALFCLWYLAWSAALALAHGLARRCWRRERT